MNMAQEGKPVRIAAQGVAERGVSGRRFASLVTGGAALLALVLATAMPAKADSKDDLAKALIAALVVGVVVNELNDKAHAEPVRQKRVPKVCEISIDGSHRSVSLFSENCMRREGFKPRLPRRCATEAKIFGKRDTVYAAQCLRDAGFRVSGR